MTGGACSRRFGVRICWEKTGAAKHKAKVKTDEEGRIFIRFGQFSKANSLTESLATQKKVVAMLHYIYTYMELFLFRLHDDSSN